MSKILKVKARQVFDSRGNPTIEAEVFIKKISASAICDKGAKSPDAPKEPMRGTTGIISRFR